MGYLVAKASGYITIKPEFDPDGLVKNVKLESAYQKFPTSLSGGAVAIKLEIEIPDEVFEPAQVHIFVDEEHIMARRPVRVYVVSDDEDE